MIIYLVIGLIAVIIFAAKSGENGVGLWETALWSPIVFFAWPLALLVWMASKSRNH